MSKETTFENARVGDRVWDAHYGWGKITGHRFNGDPSLQVEFNSPLRWGCIRYNFEGVPSGGCSPSLFWDEVKFEAPVRPKRKVKKVIEGWYNMYLNGSMSYRHYTKQNALDCNRINAIGEPVFIHHEYEVEEE